ncbi:hypothetical protein BU17DRAFT_65085 [Hysterangium stoloniferum]|nr:hypothetical protein BU17DRAFT_65085 [Hysterangium stoloniferum]
MLEARECLQEMERLIKDKTSEIVRSEKSFMVPLHVAHVVHGITENLYHSPLEELNVNLDSGEIAMSGPSDGVKIAEERIREIEREVEEVSIDTFFYELFKLDKNKQFWSEIVKRCTKPGSFPEVLELLILRGNFPPVRDELERLMRIGHTHVTGKRISVSLQKCLFDEHGRLVDDLEARLRVAVYLPSSGAYGNIDMPDNMHRYLSDVPPEEVVKLVGDTREACNEARNILEDWIKKMLTNVVSKRYTIPEVLYMPLKFKMAKKFSGAVDVDSAPPQTTQSFTSLLGHVTKSGTGWSIRERDLNIPLVPHDIRLAADTIEHRVAAGEYLQDLVYSLAWRIGVFQLEPDNILSLNPNIELLNAEHEMLYFDIQESSRQAIITGYSTNDVEMGIQRIQTMLLTSNVSTCLCNYQFYLVINLNQPGCSEAYIGTNSLLPTSVTKNQEWLGCGTATLPVNLRY